MDHQPRLLVLDANCLSYMDMLTGMEVQRTVLQNVVLKMTRRLDKHTCLAIHGNHIHICCQKPPRVGKDYVQPVNCSHSSLGLQMNAAFYGRMFSTLPSHTVWTKLACSTAVASHLISVLMQRNDVLSFSCKDLTSFGTAAELQWGDHDDDEDDETLCMGLTFSKGCMYVAM